MQFLIFLVFFAISQQKAQDDLKYTVVEKFDQFEIRDYQPFVISQTKMINNDKTFMKLAQYFGIFGKPLNLQNIRMDMMKPVFEFYDEKNQDIMAFTLPGQYNLESAPTPINKNIKINQIQGKFAVFTFNGYYTLDSVQDLKNNFQTILNENSVEINEQWKYAQFDSPWVLPEDRKNQIWFQL